MRQAPERARGSRPRVPRDGVDEDPGDVQGRAPRRVPGGVEFGPERGQRGGEARARDETRRRNAPPRLERRVESGESGAARAADRPIPGIGGAPARAAAMRASRRACAWNEARRRHRKTANARRAFRLFSARLASRRAASNAAATARGSPSPRALGGRFPLPRRCRLARGAPLARGARGRSAASASSARRAASRFSRAASSRPRSARRASASAVSRARFAASAAAGVRGVRSFLLAFFRLIGRLIERGRRERRRAERLRKASALARPEARIRRSRE